MTSDESEGAGYGGGQVPRTPWPRSAKRVVARRLPPLQRLLEERERLSGEVHDLRREIHRLHGDLDKLNGLINSLYREGDALREELADLREELADLRGRCGTYPPGHFHSPLPDFEEIRARERQVFDRSPELAGVDLRSEAQLAWSTSCGSTPRTSRSAPTRGRGCATTSRTTTSAGAMVWCCSACSAICGRRASSRSGPGSPPP